MAQELPLTEKWRPRVLDEIIGQANALAKIRKWMARGIGGHSLLFKGPTGVGKTTTALCLARELGIVTTRDTYQRIKDGFNWNLRFYAAGDMDANSVDEFNVSIRTVPFCCDYRMAVIDEAQTLTPKAQERMKNALEGLPPYALVILTTTSDKADFDPALYGRLKVVEFEKPDAYELEAHLRTIAMLETNDGANFHYQKILAACRGSVREAVSLLEDELPA